MTNTMTTAMNGVNVDRLRETIAAVQADPALGAFQFRTSNRWLGGGHNCSTIENFEGPGSEDRLRTALFELHAAEPPVLLGEDQAPNPVEFVLHALAACLTTSMAYHAAARGIAIRSLKCKLTGDLDLRGFLGISGDVRKGYQQIRVDFEVDSDSDAETLRELTRFSPVFDVVSNPVPVQVEVQVNRPNR